MIRKSNIFRTIHQLNIHSIIRRKRFKYYAPKTIDIGKVEPKLLNRKFNCNTPNQNGLQT